MVDLQADAESDLPMPIHMPSDRQNVVKRMKSSDCPRLADFCSFTDVSCFFFFFFFSMDFPKNWRYLDGLDEETRAAVIKKYIPDEPFGGSVLS